MSSLIWQLQTERGKGQRIPSIEEAQKYELTDQEKEKLNIMKQNMIIGNPQEVGKALHQLQTKYKTDEMMILTITHSPKDRVNSYRLIAEKVL